MSASKKVPNSGQFQAKKKGKNPSLEPFQTWLGDNMKNGEKKKCLGAFLLFHVFCLVGVLLPEDIGEPTMCNVKL